MARGQAGDGAHHHRPATGLKQSNKAFRPPGGTSKSDLRDASKGRVQRTAKAGKPNAQQSKQDRRNTAKQLQLAKRRALVEATRADAKTPRVVAIVALSADIELDAIVSSLLAASSDEAEASTSTSTLRQTIVRSGARSTTLQVLTPAYDDLHGALDACAAADYILLVLSPTVSVASPDWGDTFLRALLAQGVPDLGHGLRLLCAGAIDTPTRKSLLSFADHFFPSAAGKLYDPLAPGERANLLRSLCESVPRGLGWREERSRILAEGIERDGDDLLLTGHVRGRPLDVNKLVHLGGIGDFRIKAAYDASIARAPRRAAPAAMEGVESASGPTVLAERDDAEADDLLAYNEPDDELGGEQVEPTEEEIRSAPANQLGTLTFALPDAPIGTTPKRLKRVPKGMSDYQAAWIVDEEGEGEGEDDDGADEDAIVADDDVAPSLVGPPSEEETELVPSSSRVRFDMPTAEEEAAFDAMRAKQRDKAAAEDAQFPDEVDTPFEIPARVRFARYRGLQSFRTSPWDPYENLPADYARCFRLENWRAMGKRAVEGAAADEAIEVGQRVTLRIEGVPRETVEGRVGGGPLLAYGLHRHEHKFSVVHFTILRNSEFDAPIRSKDPLLVQLGPRRFEIRPIFSQHNPANGGRGANNVHKFERFLPPSSTVASVATCYLPITFGVNVPALVFTADGSALVGTGSLLSCDPTRIIAKRVLLTGYPIKVHTRTATLKSMFWNADDVAYFKPIALRTKHGRTGHIRESLGTHGLFKASFDGPLDQQDTVCLNLFKRCFPRWGRHLGEAADEVEAEMAVDEA